MKIVLLAAGLSRRSARRGHGSADPLIYGFVAPGLLAFLASSQAWFADARAWIDPKYNQETLLAGDLAGEQ